MKNQKAMSLPMEQAIQTELVKQDLLISYNPETGYVVSEEVIHTSTT
jgi:hypothetical protein